MARYNIVRRTPFALTDDLLVKHQNDPWWNMGEIHERDFTNGEEEEEGYGDDACKGTSPKAFVARRPRTLQPDPFSGLRQSA